MGVSASLTLSMRYAGRLWGLIAGHHVTATPFPWQVRAACELLAQTVSLQLAYVEERQHVSASSAGPGRGSEFVVSLPLVGARKASLDGRSPAPADSPPSVAVPLVSKDADAALA